MANTMAYKWKTNYFKADANVAGKVLEKLEATVGVTPKNLVDASRDESAPLHDEFEWDDAIAGEKYRETKAGVLIRNLAVEIVAEKSEPVEVRAYLPLEKEKPYEKITSILYDTRKTSCLLDIAIKELGAFQKKYAMLSELAGVFREIDKLKGGDDEHGEDVA